jgi:hypothetical protein
VRRLVFAIVVLTASVADAATVSGIVVDAKTAEPLAGVTVVAGGSDPSTGEQVVITDEHGLYAIDVPPGIYTITMYYSDTTVVVVRGLAVTGDVALGLTSIAETVACCIDWWFDEHDPTLSSDPRFGLTMQRDFRLPTRERTHLAWIAPAAAADPARVVTVVDGGARFAGAPGIPLAFVDEVRTYTLRVPIAQPAGSGGGTEVWLRTGSNELRGETTAVLDRDALAGEAFASGPIVHDKAWFGAGLVATRDSAAGLVDANYAASYAHQGALQALVQPHDAWANASWVSKLYDGKLELTGRATAERLELIPLAARAATPLAPTIVDRAGGLFDLKARKKFHGYHHFAFAAGGGAGERGDTHHSDASVAVGDEWQLLPNLDVHAGVRSDARAYGNERVTVVSPRAELDYDVTKEGRSDLFIAFQRTPLVDDSLPGDWLGLRSLYRDELAIGASYLPSAEHWPMVGVAARTRRSADASLVEHGVEGWLRVETHRTQLHAAATSLGRVATLAGRRTLYDCHHHQLFTSASARVSPDAREAGAALAWHHAGDLFTSSDRSASVDVQLEGFAGTAGPGARLVLGAVW